MSQPVAELPSLAPSFAGSLAVSFLSLGLVCLLAYVALRWMARRGSGLRSGRGPMRVLGRCPIEPRRQLVVVEVAGRTLLLGSAEGGLSLLAELSPEEAQNFEREAGAAAPWLGSQPWARWLPRRVNPGARISGEASAEEVS